MSPTGEFRISCCWHDRLSVMDTLNGALSAHRNQVSNGFAAKHIFTFSNYYVKQQCDIARRRCTTKMKSTRCVWLYADIAHSTHSIDRSDHNERRFVLCIVYLINYLFTSSSVYLKLKFAQNVKNV